MIVVNNKKRAITLSEAMLTMVILGIIGLIVIPIVLYHNPMKQGYHTLAIKTSEALEQAVYQIVTNHCVYDDLMEIKDKEGLFSIESTDIDKRMAELFRQYVNDLDMPIDLTKEYYNTELLDSRKNPINVVLKDDYSGFFWSPIGAIIGFRFYESCESTEPNASLPKEKEKHIIDNICGSVFFDVNAYKKPNLVGVDQYILPIGKRGIVYIED